MAAEGDIKVRESDIQAYAEKARRTVDELANEARSLGQDSAGTLRDILSAKNDELNDFVQSARGNAEALAGGVKGAVEKGRSMLGDALGQKKT
jgi:DNA-binding ferritin-like protein